MAPPRPWSSLPEELLELIFKGPTMDVADLLICRDVCVSWRSIIKRLLGKELVAQFLSPLLFFHNKISNSDKPSSNFHTNATDFYRLGFPFTHGGRFFMYSFRGWLLSSASDKFSSDLQLLNPFSGAKIQLSQPPRDFEFPFRFILSGSPSSKNCIILILDRHRRELALCKPEKDWSILRAELYEHPYEDLIFHKNQFYTIRDWGSLEKFELHHDRQPYLTLLDIQEVQGSTRRYLVESLCGTLLMVFRYMRWKKESLDTCSYKTTMFVVFWMDWRKNEWKYMANLGDQALFLAHNDSRIVSAQNPTMYKRNCIYFVDDAMEGYCKSRGTDFGVFDMENKTIEQFCSVPFNRWFKPNI